MDSLGFKTSDGIDGLVQAISSIQIDTSNLEGLEVEEDKLEWYHERFVRCREDGVPEAIDAYLTKLLGDDVNELTRLHILRDSLQFTRKVED